MCIQGTINIIVVLFKQTTVFTRPKEDVYSFPLADAPPRHIIWYHFCSFSLLCRIITIRLVRTSLLSCVMVNRNIPNVDQSVKIMCKNANQWESRWRHPNFEMQYLLNKIWKIRMPNLRMAINTLCVLATDTLLDSAKHAWNLSTCTYWFYIETV